MGRFERLRRLLRGRRALSEEVEEEIRFHLEERTRALMREEGLGREEAGARARREFGDVSLAREALGREDRRRERRSRWAEWAGEIRQDWTFGVRKLHREPGFAAVAVGTLALAIGATTAIFSVAQAVLFRPLPYPEPDELVALWEHAPDGDERNVVSSGNYLDWRDQATTFEELGAYGWYFGQGLLHEGEAVQIRGTTATPSTFRLLGAEAALGRVFTEDEAVPGSGSVILIGHGLWRTRFGADREIVGKSIVLDDRPFTVVGVMPPGFRFPEPDLDFWMPRRFDAEDRQERRSHQFRVVGRLAEGRTIDGARAEMETIAARLAREYPEHMQGWGVTVRPYRDDLVREARPLIGVLAGVVTLVLLLACANLANLLLARSTARERELAVRRAIGAGRARLFRQLLSESLLLAVVGGVLGLLVAFAGVEMIVAFGPADVPLLDETRLDPVVLAASAGVTLLSALLFGLLPALRLPGFGPGAGLRAAGASAVPVRSHARGALLVAEVALAVVLTVGAALLFRSFHHLQDVDLGFDAEGLVYARYDVPLSRYGEQPEQIAFHERYLERVRSLPGVEAAAGTTEPPIIGYNNTFSFAIEGRPSGDPDGRYDPVALRAVTADFFRTARIGLLRGRVLDERDGPEAPRVVVLNRSLAERHWPDGDAVGSRISFSGPDEGPWWEVVGVVADTRHYSADEPARPALYVSHSQRRWSWMSWMTLMVRTDGDPEEAVRALERALAEIDARIPLESGGAVTSLYAETMARRRFATVLLGAFSLLALTLGTIGVYGVLAYDVARRTRELGVRIALGASRARVARRVVRDGVVLAGIGVAIGVPLALALTGSLRSLLFGVAANDPLTFGGVAGLILAVAAAAAWVPARRATRVDPLEALRSE